MEAGGVAPLPSPGPWVESDFSHEGIEAVPKPDVSGLLLGSLGHNPEQQEPGNASVGVLVLEGLAVGVWLKREGQRAIRTCPQRHVAGVGVGQCALDQLTRHIGPLNRIRTHADIDRSADQFVRWAAS